MKRERDLADHIIRCEFWTSIGQGARLILAIGLVITAVVYVIKGELQEATFAIVLALLIRPRG